MESYMDWVIRNDLLDLSLKRIAQNMKKQNKTKPRTRLSMKLLYKIAQTYQSSIKGWKREDTMRIADFLMFIESEMKSHNI